MLASVSGLGRGADFAALFDPTQLHQQYSTDLADDIACIPQPHESPKGTKRAGGPLFRAAAGHSSPQIYVCGPHGFYHTLCGVAQGPCMRGRGFC